MSLFALIVIQTVVFLTENAVADFTDTTFPHAIKRFERDADEVDIRLYTEAPSGLSIYVPAFYTQHFERYLDNEGVERFRAVAEPHWCVRMTPREEGLYRFFWKPGIHRACTVPRIIPSRSALYNAGLFVWMLPADTLYWIPAGFSCPLGSTLPGLRIIQVVFITITIFNDSRRPIVIGRVYG